MDEIPAKTNYLFGKDASRWITQVPNFERLKIERARPGVDVSYYGNNRQLEYDLDLAPGADPKGLALRFTGAEHLTLAADGALNVATTSAPLTCTTLPTPSASSGTSAESRHPMSAPRGSI